MTLSKGRNTRLENAYRAISGFVARLLNIPTGQTAPTAGHGYTGIDSLTGRRYDQEYIEIPIRDAANARQLIELRKVPEVATALDTIVGDAFSSEDGDDLGVTISETLPDGTAVDPVVYAIALALVERCFSASDLGVICEEFLIYGDSFRSLLLSDDLKRIERIKQLPTWEMFRIEDFNQNPIEFQQRSMLSGEPDYTINPAVCVHWRFRRKYKYGRSLFQESLIDIEPLTSGYYALDKAALSIGINPNLHVMPQGWDIAQKKAYQEEYERQKRIGVIVTDFYTTSGGDVRKAGGTYNPDLKALLDNVLQRRGRLAMRSRIPPWMLGLATQGPREIAGQPALAYARFIGSVRIVLAEGLRQIIDMELALNGIEPERMRYSLRFPKIYTRTIDQGGVDEVDEEGIQDLA